MNAASLMAAIIQLQEEKDFFLVDFGVTERFF